MNLLGNPLGGNLGSPVGVDRRPSFAAPALGPTVVSVTVLSGGAEVRVTFSEPMTGDFYSGVTITVDDVARGIEDASYGGGSDILIYVITGGNISIGQVVTWEYSQAAGAFVATATGLELEETPPIQAVIT